MAIKSVPRTAEIPVPELSIESFRGESFGSIDIFRSTATQWMKPAHLFKMAQVCKDWCSLSGDSVVWKEFFMEEGIPCVMGPDEKLRYSKQEFKLLHSMTLSLKMSETFFGKVDRIEMPTIHWTWLDACSKEDPFRSGKLMKDIFKFVVVPDYFERVAGDEFPFILDENEDLVKAPLGSGGWRGEVIQIPITIRNFKILCENPREGEKRPVFRKFHDVVLKQCNTRLNKISVLFMRKFIADETRGLSNPLQEALVKKWGFGVAPLLPRMLVDVESILRTGTCADGSVDYVSTSDAVHLSFWGFNHVCHATIGNFDSRFGLDIEQGYSGFQSIGAVPSASAELPHFIPK